MNLRNSNLFPGDIYEIKTRITRQNGQDLDIGNGTIDIAVRTGTLGNSPSSENNTFTEGSLVYPSSLYEETRGVELFSTFNSALKWQMSYNQSAIETSNTFVMPNVPGSYHGFHIAIGPGNSDVDFGASKIDSYYNIINPLVTGNVPNVLRAYPFNSYQRPIKSTAQIPHNFGTGHPWSMMIPIYNSMAINPTSILGGAGDPLDLYKTWWASMNEISNNTRENVPTKFDQTVELDKVELIRYSKNAYMLQGVRVYKVNGDYAHKPDGTITGRVLISQKRLEYRYVNEALIRNYDYPDYTTPPALRRETNFNRRIILLNKVREVPVTVSEDDFYIHDFNFASSDDTSKVLTTFLGYKKILDNVDLNSSQPMTYDNMKPWQGIAQYVLDTYVDHLGGITKVEYYPFGGNGETRSSINYIFNPCNNFITHEAIGKAESHTGHVAVKFLGKNDEGDSFTPAPGYDPFNTNNINKVWEYQYDLSSKIFNPKQMRMPNYHFRSQYLFRDEVAFGSVRVISPALPNGERTHIDYEYYGHNNPDPLTTPSKEDFLLYGKLKTMKTYDHNNVLHEEKIIEYDYTLAFENAYIRPNLMREKLGYDDYYARSYEYEDIYKNEILTMDIPSGPGTTSTLVGPATYPSIDVPVLHGLGSGNELPKFMEFWFYNDLANANEKYFFDSYFIKKTSEITRVYDNSMEKIGVVVVPVGPVIEDSPANPFGTGVINNVPDDPIADEPLMTIINDPNSPNVFATLMANVPLSDAVLNTLINSSMKANEIANVLAAHGGLSNSVWNSFINKRGKFSSSNYSLMINSQPYFSDAIQSHLLQALTVRDNYVFPKDLLLKNEYLSGSIVLEMTHAANKFPEEVFSEVISAQSNLAESTVLEIIKCVHVTDNTLVNLLSDQVLTDELWDEILQNPEFSTNTLTELVESTLAFPSDKTLMDILDYSPAFNDREIERIFAILNRPLSGEVEEKLLTNFPQVGPHIALRPFTGNPLSQYCGNAVIEGRTYIETRTDYEYYEADHTGKSIGIAYELLLGHRSSATDPSPYPYTAQTATALSNAPISKVVNNLRLKHEPSWQVFSVQTSSPQHPNAYSREEYFYLYDLQNRYDRYWYNYDLESGDVMITDVDPLNGFYSADTIGYNVNWASEYSDPYHPHLPKFDGMERTRTYGNRVLAFQKSVISKNSRDEDPLIRSEYYDYDRRWIFNDLPSGIETIEHDWGPCPAQTSGGGDPCEGLYGCTDCYWFKYLYDEQMQALVPLGHCAYSSPTYGWFICPFGSDVSTYAPDATLQYCNLGTSTNNISPPVNPLIVAQPKALQTADYFSKTLLLRSVTVQVDTLDHSVNQEFGGIKMDGKNQYIAEFELGNVAQTDVNNFSAPYEMIYPFDNLTVRTIKERNRYLQPALEENQVGLLTRYYYNKSQSLWNTNINCVGVGSGASQNYLSHLNEDIAKPIRITVGYTKLDSLSIAYEYNDISQLRKVTEPSGKFIEFDFDNYHRLISQDENGVRHLTDIQYGYWDHNMNANFDIRTDSNYVQTFTYNEAPSANPYDINREVRKAFIDPLGRTHSVATQYSLDGFNHVEVHSGSVTYDNWGRAAIVNKNFRNDLTTQTIGAPRIILDDEFTNPFAETRFENNPKGRALRTSNYDVDVAGIHAVKSKYAIVNDIFASCELDLNLSELELVFGSGNTAAFKLFRTEILDQDNKRSIDYVNALGQKVASLKINSNNQRIVTLFAYDSYGNLTKVINPEKQESDYEFNMLGQMVKETTIDAGTKRYMYNKQGLVSITLDEQGQFYNPNGNGLPGDPSAGTTDAFYRVYKYDDYGRLLIVGRSSAPIYSLDQEFGPLHYETTFIGEGPGEPENWITTANGRYLDYVYSNASSQDWLASYDVWGSAFGAGGMQVPQLVTIGGLDAFYPTIVEKEFMYGGTVPQTGLGKVKTTYSYNNEGLKVLKTAFTYDSFDNVATQTTTFNSNGNVDVTQEVTSVIEYPSYNYRNSLKQQTVDVNGDGVVDYHCFMEYDALNRLKAIHGAAGFVNSIDEATLLVSYEFDDANGLVDKKKHFADDENGLAVLANEIDYNYDTRDRLTEIAVGLPSLAPNKMMHYQLFYDDNSPTYLNAGNTEFVSHTKNWNGNINGTLMSYDLQASNIVTPVDNFDKPLLYGYTYDKINRMIAADATVGNFLLAGLTDAERRSIGDVSVRYDRIGNIESLHRTCAGADILNPTPVLPISEIQHWNYNYFGATNRLTGVTGQSGAASRAYTYDANGNLLTDNSKDIDATEYGRAAYPFEILQDETTLTYLYSENDLRIYKKSLLSLEVGNEWSSDYYLMDAFGKTVAIMHQTQNLPNGEWEYYASGADRECRLQDKNGDGSFKNTTNANGEIELSFYLYDHLGNTRLTYSPEAIITHSGDPATIEYTIQSVMDYFPYGKVLRHDNVTDERFLTTQHERDAETDLDYRGARYYDNEVGRFLSLDPLAKEYPSFSDYVYVGDNPVVFVDPDGKKIVFPNKASREQAATVLRNLGVDKDFRINERGVLKKRFTPFSKDGELTKGISEKVKSRDITEVSFTDKENWSVGNYENIELDISSQEGSGSAKTQANYTYDGFPLLNPRDVTLLVISSNNGNKNDKEVAATFVGGLFDVETPENENATREQLGIDKVESSSVQKIDGTSPGGSSEQTMSSESFDAAVNSNDSGRFNYYYQFIPFFSK